MQGLLSELRRRLPSVPLLPDDIGIDGAAGPTTGSPTDASLDAAAVWLAPALVALESHHATDTVAAAFCRAALCLVGHGNETGASGTDGAAVATWTQAETTRRGGQKRHQRVRRWLAALRADVDAMRAFTDAVPALPDAAPPYLDGRLCADLAALLRPCIEPLAQHSACGTSAEACVVRAYCAQVLDRLDRFPRPSRGRHR